MSPVYGIVADPFPPLLYANIQKQKTPRSIDNLDVAEQSKSRRPLSGHSLGLRLDRVEDLLRRALDDTASDGKAGAVLQVQIDLASSHATLVDTPGNTG